MTQEQIEKSISAANDSIALINDLKSKENKTDDNILSIERNIEHLKIMMSKDWFVNNIDKTHKTQINNLIKI
jgi:hypothetical protein